MQNEKARALGLDVVSSLIFWPERKCSCRRSPEGPWPRAGEHNGTQLPQGGRSVSVCWDGAALACGGSARQETYTLVSVLSPGPGRYPTPARTVAARPQWSEGFLSLWVALVHSTYLLIWKFQDGNCIQLASSFNPYERVNARRMMTLRWGVLKVWSRGPRG